jgi:hypothetical protein
VRHCKPNEFGAPIRGIGWCQCHVKPQANTRRRQKASEPNYIALGVGIWHEASDEQEITLKFVPFPVCLPGDKELVWLLGKRENLSLEEAGMALTKAENRKLARSCCGTGWTAPSLSSSPAFPPEY